MSSKGELDGKSSFPPYQLELRRDLYLAPQLPEHVFDDLHEEQLGPSRVCVELEAA